MTDSEIKEILELKYYYRDGKLFYQPRRNKDGSLNSYSDKEAGGLGHDGYHLINLIEGKQFRRARAVFLMFNGYLPETVDHINRVRTDDFPENLRDSNPVKQAANRSVRKDSGTQERNIKKVCNGNYRVQIRRKTESFDKTFSTLEEAVEARDLFLQKISI